MKIRRITCKKSNKHDEIKSFKNFCETSKYRHVLNKELEKERKRRYYQEVIAPKEPEPNKVNDKRNYYRNEYLKSDHWKSLKKEKLKKNNLCEICGSKKKLDVHHLDYKNLYDVVLEDLMTVCRRCHCKIHEKI